MKQLYLIGGPMGVGKTSVCQQLKHTLPNAVFLDGDWCWDADPFQVTAATKAMVLDNICHVLNNFLHCPAYEHVLFAWVMHEQHIIDHLRRHLDLRHCQCHALSLCCNEANLRARLTADIADGLRQPEVIGRSLAYLDRYDALDTIKIDTSGHTIDAVVRTIIAHHSGT